MEFSTPRRPQRTQQDTLDGEEVLEITLFAEKREWIQDKITFLSTTLPRIVVHEPLPPLQSTTTKEELESWWKEHEAIETEVHEYDYGDLTKMRNFAKQKSKQQLSRRDTDLIEVCLTTIFALDKLLSLLRQRRKSLVLLEYRLQWEESSKTAWNAHRQLLEEEIPSFLIKSGFNVPQSSPADDSESLLLPESIEPGALSKSVSHSSITSASSFTSSTSTSHRRRRLSSLSSHSHTRALRHQTLLLSLSSLKSHLHTLTSTHLPTSSTLLDKLIDHSPEPLPDAFLDEQDKIEDIIKADFGVKGSDMSKWLEMRVEEWKKSDEVWSRSTEVERESEMLGEEVEAESRKLRITDRSEVEEEEARKQWVCKFEERLGKIGETLGQAKGILEDVRHSSSNPHHSIRRLFPQHSEESHQLVSDLAQYLQKSETILEETSRTVGQFRRRVSVVERARKMRDDLEKALRELKRAKEGVGLLGSPPSDSGQEQRGVEEERNQEYENRFNGIFSAKLDLDNVTGLIKEGLGIVAELVDAGIDSNSRRELKQLISGVEESRKEVEKLRTVERTRRARAGAIRGVLNEIKLGRKRLEELRGQLQENAEKVRWEEGKDLGEPDDLDFDEVIQDIKERTSASLQGITSILKAVPSILSTLTAQITSLDHGLDSSLALQRAVKRTKTQAEAVKDLEEELKPIRLALEAISSEAKSSIEVTPATSESLTTIHHQLSQQLDTISSALSPLVSDVHLRIPFLSTSTSSSLISDEARTEFLPFDVIAHDSSVKLYLNTLVARVNQEQEETRTRIDSVRIAGKIAELEKKQSSLEDEMKEIELQLASCEDAILDRLDDEEATLAALEEPLNSTSTQFSSIATALETHYASLTEFVQAIDASQLPPHFNTDRRLSVLELKRRSSITEQRVRLVRERIEKIRRDREEREKSWIEGRGRLHSALEVQGHDLISLGEEAKSVLRAIREEEVKALGTPTLIDDAVFVPHTTATLASIQSRLQSITDKLVVHSDELCHLESTLPSRSFSDNLSTTQNTFHNLQAACQESKETLDNAEAAFRTNQVRLAQLRAERAQQLAEQAEIATARRQKKEEEEANARLFSDRLSLAREIALPEDDSADSEAFDVFGRLPTSSSDLFAPSSSVVESSRVSDIRAKAEMLRVQDWLDSEAIFRLPDMEESNVLRNSLRDLQHDFDVLRTDNGSDDVHCLGALVTAKEEEVKRISDLASFSQRVETADAALSDLLDSIDATTSGILVAQHPSPLPLSEAIIQAIDAVTATRLEAIPLIDDRRVKQAVERIEESWTEMMLMAEEARPRSGSAASSTSSARSSRTASSGQISTRIPSRQTKSRRMSRSTSSTSSTASLHLPRTRPSSRSSLTPLSSGSPSLSRSLSRSSSFVSTPTRNAENDNRLATPRRQNGQSGIPFPTPRRNNISPLPPLTPTTARPFSFSARTPNAKAPSSIPRRTPFSTPRQGGGNSRSSSTSENAALSSSSMFRSVSSSSRASTGRRDSLASSVSSRRSSAASSSYHRPSLSPENLSRIGYRSSPPRHKRPQYRANLSNKLDREVGSIVNALDIHVPIEMADGSWSDESGMYKIGDKVYFCRILRSKNVMVRVGGGWLNLLQFIITHFAPAEKINISPTTPVKRTLGNEPQWISSTVIREQLVPTQSSSSSLHRHVTSPITSTASQHEQPRSLSASISMRRSISSASHASTPLRRSIGGSGSHQGVLSPATTGGGTPRRRPAIPVWRP